MAVLAVFAGAHGFAAPNISGVWLRYPDPEVQTFGVREDVRFGDIPHTPKMKITERIRLVAPDWLENKITIEDPQILAQPYQFTFGYKRDRSYRIMEYICDNNREVVDEEGKVGVKVERADSPR